MARAEKYGKLYEELWTKQGDRKVYIMAKSRNVKRKDVEDGKVIKGKGNELTKKWEECGRSILRKRRVKGECPRR